MRTEPSTDRGTRVTAELLFGLCVATVLAIYFLDSSLGERRQAASKRWNRHEAHYEMLNRLRAFRSRNPTFYEGLVRSAFTSAYKSENLSRYPTIVPSRRTKNGRTTFYEMAPALRWELEKATRQFGVRAAAAFEGAKTPLQLHRELRNAVAISFNNPEATLYLDAEVMPQLEAVYSRSGFNGVAWWISQNEWPTTHGGGFGEPIPGVGFGKRFPDSPSDFSDRFYIYELLRFEPNIGAAESDLLKMWKESYMELHTSPGTPERIGLPVLGLSLTVDAFLVAAAPILVLLQLMFLVQWEHRSSNDPSFEFPSYACPTDPLHAPFPRTLGQFVQRGVWMLFLVLPIGLFTVGLLFRYDFGYILGYFHGSTTTLIDAVQQARSEDLLSKAVDAVTLSCIAVSAICVMVITRDPAKPAVAENESAKRKRLVAGWSVAIGAAIACVAATWIAYRAFLAPISNADDVRFRLQYLILFGVEFSLLLGLAWHVRARFVQAIALGGLLFFALHFVPL